MAGSRFQRAVLIAGPTASGKSSVAMEVAGATGGTIINADAMQVYAELRILTSRPSKADEAAVPHRLYGFTPARTRFSAGRWLEAARAEISRAWQAGRPAIVTGGTGLYFKVLEEGLSPVPAVPRAVREAWRQRLSAEGSEALHAELARAAPGEAERLNPADGQRVVRSLEVLEATGQTLSSHHAAARSGSVLAGADVRRVALVPPREELYGVCDVRFETMMARGALEEVDALLALGLDEDLPAMKAIGVRSLAAHLTGELKLAEAVAQAKTQTRNYAKRQMTWIRNQMRDWAKVERRADAVRIVLNG